MSKKGEMTIDPPACKPAGRLRRSLLLLLVLVLIALGFLFFAARTESARRMIEEHVARQLGLSVTVAKARIGFPYDLVLEDVVSRNFGEGDQPWFKAQEIRLGLGFRTTFRLSIRRAVVNVVREARDRMEPEILHRVANLNLGDPADINRATEPLRARFDLRVTDSALEWRDRRGDGVGGLQGIVFRLCPVDIPEHSMYYHAISIYQATGVEAGSVVGSLREWLVERDGPPLELRMTSDAAVPVAPAPVPVVAPRDADEDPVGFGSPVPGVPPGMERKLPYLRRDKRSTEE